MTQVRHSLARHSITLLLMELYVVFAEGLRYWRLLLLKTSKLRTNISSLCYSNIEDGKEAALKRTRMFKKEMCE